SRGSAAHILPSLELYDYRSPTMHVIRNVPASTDIAAAKALVDASKDDGTEEDKHVIAFVNGTVDRSRNIDTIIETAEMLLAMDKDIARFKIATNKAIQTTKTGDLPQNFIHLGGLPQRESLAEYARCDLVLTFCDADMVASYKYAWPNKWGDAIAMGTPIVVNGDMVHARQFIEAGAGFDCPCGDAQAFADLLIALHEDRDRLKAASNAIEGFQDTFRPFDIELAAILNTVEADTKSG
ncbi:MAG: glycosyltransferase, partial [Pseudomonadota bacterium]